MTPTKICVLDLERNKHQLLHRIASIKTPLISLVVLAVSLIYNIHNPKIAGCGKKTGPGLIWVKKRCSTPRGSKINVNLLAWKLLIECRWNWHQTSTILDRSNSFEEELFRGLPRDDGNGDNDEDDDVLMSDEIKRSASQRLSAAR